MSVDADFSRADEVHELVKQPLQIELRRLMTTWLRKIDDDLKE